MHKSGFRRKRKEKKKIDKIVEDSSKEIKHDDIFAENRKKIEDQKINPSYYHGKNVLRFIQEFNLSFELGQVIKYVSRARNKGGLEDLKKARWYLDEEIDKIEKIVEPLNKRIDILMRPK